MFRHGFLLALILGCGSSPPKPTQAWTPVVERDATRHTARMVNVAPGVALEVLDFGGTGDPILLLAGLGNTAHVYDDFAPLLTAHHHIYAVTRRGFGASGAPETGYDLATRVADDVAVLDALGLARAIFIGHSIAGGELTRLAGFHPDRVTAVIYLDAASDNAEVEAELAKEPFPKEPPMPPADHLYDSLANIRAFVQGQLGIEWPVGELLANLTIDASGKITGETGRPDAGTRIISGLARVDFTKVSCPALALFAEPPPIQEGFGAGWNRLDDAGRAAWLAADPRIHAAWKKNLMKVTAELRGVRIVTYAKAHHYLFIRRQREVLDEIQKFLAEIPK